MTNLSISSRLAPDWVVVAARWCLLTAGLFAPWIAMAALPPFRFGIWIDSEPTLVVYHWVAALFALGIFLNQVRSPNPPYLFVNPVLVLFIALIILSLITMPFALDGALTWYGLPQTGQGILSLISFIFYLLGFQHLLQEKYGHFLWINTATAIITVACITMAARFNPESQILADWAPFVFSAFLAFMSIGFLALSFTSDSRYFKIGGIALSCGVVLLSANKTAIVSLFIALGLLESKTIATYLKKKARMWLSLIVGLAPLLIIICMLAFSSPTRFPSLWSRVRLLQMVALELWEHPFELLVGLGWGSYTDAFLANLTRVPEAMYQNGVWNPTWDALDRIDFHSHHQVVEALLATGLLGAIIVLLLPAIAVYISDRDKIIPAFIVFFLYTTTSSGWFEMPATLPFIALSYAAFAPRDQTWGRKVSFKALMPFSAMAVILCFAGGMRVFDVGIAYPSTDSIITKNFGATTPLSCDSGKDATGPGDAHLAHSLRSVANESAFYGFANKQVFDELSELVCAANSVAKPTLSLTISLLSVTGDVANEDVIRWVKPLRAELLPKWRSRLESMLIRAPYRTDLLAPYFRWEIKQGRGEAVKKWCDRILAENHNDPIALWFKGLILRDTIDQKSIGYRFLNQALDAGVNRLLPVRPHLQNEIERYNDTARQ